MTQDFEANPIADATTREWAEPPRVQGIYAKQLLTADVNPLASVAMVQMCISKDLTRNFGP